ncbi:MAG: EamA/RhaT family transporter [Ruminococcaceae bacterium]|nr:EamA/RhaT family transporter [Oscillospiraceae bacterium]
MNENKIARIKIITAMLIFGTIGLFTKSIALPSALLASARGFIGVAFLGLCLLIRRQGIKISEIKKNAFWLLLSGAGIGFNWIFLFESYRFTGVPTATLCYYLAPAIVVFLSPIVLRERVSGIRLLAAIVALLGMVPVSGILSGGIGEPRGIGFGVAAAVLYASVIMMNKKLKDISDYAKTVSQLLIAAVVVLPYALMSTDFGVLSIGRNDIILTVIVGIVHTGIAYLLYFGAIRSLSAQSAALLSYIDPASAVLLSAAAAAVFPSVFGGEILSVTTALGAVLILGSSLFAEIAESRKK